MNFNKSEYDKIYTMKNYITVTVRLSKAKDDDIIKHLLDVKKNGYASKQSYIKSLIRRNMKK